MNSGRSDVVIPPFGRAPHLQFPGRSLLLLLFSFAATFAYSVTLGLDQLDTPTMSSYDPIPPDGVITQAQFKASMKLVRLQIAVPISVLASISANIVCALAIKPGLRRSRLSFLMPPSLLLPVTLRAEWS